MSTICVQCHEETEPCTVALCALCEGRLLPLFSRPLPVSSETGPVHFVDVIQTPHGLVHYWILDGTSVRLYAREIVLKAMTYEGWVVLVDKDGQWGWDPRAYVHGDAWAGHAKTMAPVSHQLRSALFTVMRDAWISQVPAIHHDLLIAESYKAARLSRQAMQQYDEAIQTLDRAAQTLGDVSGQYDEFRRHHAQASSH